MPLGRTSGQAAPELMGLVVVVAVLLAGLAVLAARVTLPDHPPGVLPQVAAPITPARGPSWPGIGLPGRLDVPLPGWLRRYGGAFARGGGEAAAGAVQEVRGIGAALWRDPLGTTAAIVGASVRDPFGVPSLVRDVMRLPAYIRRLRRLPPDQRWERLSHDAGRVAVDLVIQRVIYVRLRSIRNAVRDHIRRSGRTTNDPARPDRQSTDRKDIQ
ncbi:MAG: hypothetical protein U0Y82_02230 [Thermoleophilia bacterium]